METIVQLFFAGIWSMVWHWGVGIGLVVLLLAAAYFSPILKKFFLAMALGVVLVLVGETIGIHDEKAHRDAEGVVIDKDVANAVDKAKTSHQKDRWNRPEY